MAAGLLLSVPPRQRRAQYVANIVMVALATMAVFRLGACTPAPEGTDPEDAPNPIAGFEAHAMLQSLGEQIILPTYRQFQQSAVLLHERAVAWNSKLPSSSDWDATRTEAQDDWRAAMSSWQQAEAMMLGPAGSSLSTIGGMDLRDEIYSWPTVNPCRIDQRIEGEDYKESSFFTSNLV